MWLNFKILINFLDFYFLTQTQTFTESWNAVKYVDCFDCFDCSKDLKMRESSQNNYLLNSMLLFIFKKRLNTFETKVYIKLL